jgi:hypothetical protein
LQIKGIKENPSFSVQYQLSENNLFLDCVASQRNLMQENMLE